MDFKYYIIMANNSWGGGVYVTTALDNYLKQIDTDQNGFNHEIAIVSVTHPTVEIERKDVYVNEMGNLVYPEGGTHHVQTMTLNPELLIRWSNLFWRAEMAREALADTVYNTVYNELSMAL